jgi:hypothetical protein
MTFMDPAQNYIRIITNKQLPNLQLATVMTRNCITYLASEWQKLMKRKVNSVLDNNEILELAESIHFNKAYYEEVKFLTETKE